MGFLFVRSIAHCTITFPDWLMMTAEGRMQEAYELSSQTNNFPEICGRICPQDRLCEGSCVIEKGFESVTIGAVEKHITEIAFAKGWVKPARHATSGRKQLVSLEPVRLVCRLLRCCVIEAIRCMFMTGMIGLEVC